jgi:hypothetical protein
VNHPGFPRRRDRSRALSLEVTYRDVGDLIPRITNPRIHSASRSIRLRDPLRSSDF